LATTSGSIRFHPPMRCSGLIFRRAICRSPRVYARPHWSGSVESTSRSLISRSPRARMAWTNKYGIRSR
jgi:hypothetical protein